MRLLLTTAAATALLYLANQISYGFLKRRILTSRKWDLNICCGHTDGGGVNADIVRHNGVANFVKIEDVYNLPFQDGQFKTVLCSHTIEHVDDPERFYEELQRVGDEVVIVVPPLWDLSAVFNLLEHRSIFLTVRKKHHSLPRFVDLPLARTLQERFGQRIHA
jgi:SAM-dependent methyltransferase